MSPWHLKQAVRTMRRGGVIAYPTEAVWGLGCDPWNQDAVMRILELKERPVEKGLIMVAADLSQLWLLLPTLTEQERQLIATPQEVPTTWLIPDRHNLIPHWVKGEHEEVAIRVSTYSGVRSLCRQDRGMLISTSANRAGEPAATSYTEVRRIFKRELDYVLPGPLGGYSRPSEIRSLTSGTVLRS